ncbi:MAG: hypothetical protein KBD01_20410 [Acidobacteria bacterium]|nr:hypothetical protein [Acidobacteriota bacterium]
MGQRAAARAAPAAAPARGRKLVAATVGTLVALLVLEGLARLLEPRADMVAVPGADGGQVPAWLALDPALGATLGHLDRVPAHIDKAAVLRFWDFYQRDEELHYRLKPDLDAWTVNTLSPPQVVEKMRWRLTSNADGFRGRPLPGAPLPDGESLVVCLGDSSTYGWGVGEDEAYPALLERYLREAGRSGWQVVNLGHPGFTSWQGRILAQRLAELKPAIVTISFATNDESDAGLTDAELYRRDHSLPARVAGAAGHLALYRVMQRAMLKFWNPASGSADAKLTPRVPLRDYAANLGEIAAAVRRAKAQPMFVQISASPGHNNAAMSASRAAAAPYIPVLQLFEAAKPDVRSGSLYAAQVAALRERLGPFLDEHPEYLLQVDSTHPNAIGHDIIARRLASLILGRRLEPAAVGE